jgi:hypothetical protein
MVNSRFIVLERLLTSERNVSEGSNSDVASHQTDGLVFRWINVEVYRRYTGRVTTTPELRPGMSSAPTILNNLRVIRNDIKIGRLPSTELLSVENR